MREIKFRAWDTQLKKIFNDIEYHGKYKCNEKKEIFIVMQFTGLKDKNGKEIFEGDIVIHKLFLIGNTYPMNIKFRNCAFYINEILLSKCKSKDIEVLGNIYENPELLNGCVEDSIKETEDKE